MIFSGKGKVIFSLFVFTFLNSLFFSCTGASVNNINIKMKEKLYDLPENCDYSAAGNNEQRDFDCSPKLIDQFPKGNYQGILINSAPQIVWPKNADLKDMTVLPNGDAEGPFKFMITGLVNLPYNTLNLQGDFAANVVVVAINQKTAKTYNGKMIPFGFAGIKPHFPDNTNIDSLCYFNIDLVQNLEIPIENATYNIYAVLGDYKSNVLTVKTRTQ